MSFREIPGKFGRYELCVGIEGDGSTWCHVSFKKDHKEYTNSLCFIDVDGEIVALSERDLAGIRKWAESHGY